MTQATSTQATPEVAHARLSQEFVKQRNEVALLESELGILQRDLDKRLFALEQTRVQLRAAWELVRNK